MRVALLICLLIHPVFACEVRLPGKFVLNDSSPELPRELINDCSTNDTQSLLGILHNQHGLIPVSRIQAAVGVSPKITSPNQNVEVINLRYFVSEKFKDISPNELTIADNLGFAIISLHSTDQLELSCAPCSFMSLENFTLTKTSLNGEQAKLLFSARTEKKIPALKLTKTIPAFTQEIPTDAFETVMVPSNAYHRYLTDVSRLRFFKTNKTLRAGELLKESDLTPRHLVKAGDRVELIFENDHIKVKTHALSRSNGGVGDSVEVWNQANGKMYKAIIQDFNRVSVEL